MRSEVQSRQEISEQQLNGSKLGPKIRRLLRPPPTISKNWFESMLSKGDTSKPARVMLTQDAKRSGPTDESDERLKMRLKARYQEMMDYREFNKAQEAFLIQSQRRWNERLASLKLEGNAIHLLRTLNEDIKCIDCVGLC